MLIRSHPRSLKSNAIRLAKVLKNWDPTAVERLECVRRLPFPSRARRLFQETVAFLEESAHWDRMSIIRWQEERLGSLLAMAAKKVPYYRRLFADSGIRADEVTLKTMRNIPFLTREIVEQQFDRLVAEGTPNRQKEYFTTGGSTGVPLRFYVDFSRTNTLREEFFHRMWGWVGYKPWERGAILRGIPIDSDNPDAYFDYDVLSNKLLLSSYHIRPDWLHRLYTILVEFAPRSLQAYPSAATPLAQHIVDEKLPPIPSLRLILCGSENIYQWQREIIEEAFHCRVFSWYGHSENVLLAGECEKGHAYHAFSEHGVLELIRPDGSVIEGPGEVGEIVGTGFINDIMPFIRYRTGDQASYAKGDCACGRPYPRLERIDGRLQELIVTSDGRYISMTAINMHTDIFNQVRQFQFEQSEKGRLIMHIVRKPSFSDADKQKILQVLHTKMGKAMDITIDFVEHIKPTQRGKHRFLLQHLPVKFSD